MTILQMGTDMKEGTPQGTRMAAKRSLKPFRASWRTEARTKPMRRERLAERRAHPSVMPRDRTNALSSTRALKLSRPAQAAWP